MGGAHVRECLVPGASTYLPESLGRDTLPALPACRSDPSPRASRATPLVSPRYWPLLFHLRPARQLHPSRMSQDAGSRTYRAPTLDPTTPKNTGATPARFPTKRAHAPLTPREGFSERTGRSARDLSWGDCSDCRGDAFEFSIPGNNFTFRREAFGSSTSIDINDVYGCLWLSMVWCILCLSPHSPRYIATVSSILPSLVFTILSDSDAE